MDRVEALTGHPSTVHADVDADLRAEAQGPSALDRAISAAPRDVLLARYRAALWRINHDQAWHDRTAGTRTAAAEQAIEDRLTRTGRSA